MIFHVRIHRRTLLNGGASSRGKDSKDILSDSMTIQKFKQGRLFGHKLCLLEKERRPFPDSLLDGGVHV